MTDYNPRTLAGEIKDYFVENDNAIEVLIFKGKRKISIKRDFGLSPRFVRSFISNYY